MNSSSAQDHHGSKSLVWRANETFAFGKGATIQEFTANSGGKHYIIDVAPWGEGRLTVDGQEIARIGDAATQQLAFKKLSFQAERHRKGEPVTLRIPTSAPLIPAAKAKLLAGKKGLIVGIANENSIAWGCARACRALGAELAVTYLNAKAKKHVEPLANALDAQIILPLDVTSPEEIEQTFAVLKKRWGELDFLVHSIAFAPKDALQGRVTDVTRDGFATTMEVSCWSFIRMAHLAEPLMRKGGSLFTMTYYGSQRVVKKYNIMGVAKAALESAVRYLAAELGPKGIRVHAISPGPVATRAASGIPEFDSLLLKAGGKAPARRLVSIDDVGIATAFLAHDAARLITGETLYIDGGYHIMD